MIYFIESPTITSVFPNFPIVKSVSFQVFNVPNGFRGLLFSCNAIAWPPPTVSWFLNTNTKQVVQPKFSHSSSNEDSGYSSVDLSFFNGFSSTDSGEYTCRANSNSSNGDEVTITLRGINEEVPGNPFACPDIRSKTVFFQLQVKDSGCLTWSKDTTERAVDEVSDVFIGGVLSQCEDCTILGDSLIVTYGTLCLNSSDGSQTIIFRGEITTENSKTTLAILCGLTAWYLSMPLIKINNELKVVNGECSLELESLSSLDSISCSGSISTTVLVVAAGSVAGIVVPFLLAGCVIVVLVVIRKW